MKNDTEKVPDCVLASLWFANPEQLDWEKEQVTIITSILNRGTWEAVRWIYRFYGEAAICKAIAQPKRGFWFPQALNFWSKFFGISIDPQLSKQALFRL